MTDDELVRRIILDQSLMTGKPIIKGTCLTVEFILSLLAHNENIDKILDEYSGLTCDDIRACLLFAARALENTDFLPIFPQSIKIDYIDPFESVAESDWDACQ